MGVGDTVDDDADGSDDDASIKRTSANKKPLTKGKRPAAVKKSGKKQPTVKKGAKPIKKKGGKTNKGKTTSAVAKGGKTVKETKNADDSFEYRTAKDFNTPRYYSGKTLYTDTIRQMWRIKPGRGRRDHQMFSFKSDPRETWNEVVKALKK